ncbi:MAG: hypothetical protein Q7R31_04570 [Candidatus Levybacteria bacterium]|nr:hypothetical protein [Candidatus Levybacteria bacterium]
MEASNSALLSSAIFPSLISAFGLGALISGVVVTWVKSKLDQNSESKRRVRELREKQYKDFLNNLMGFFKGWEDKSFQKQFIWDVNANAPVSASDEVYRLARKYIDSFDKKNNASEDDRQKIYAKLVITMRNELNKMSGEPRTDLKEEEIKVMQLD